LLPFHKKKSFPVDPESFVDLFNPISLPDHLPSARIRMRARIWIRLLVTVLLNLLDKSIQFFNKSNKKHFFY